MREGEVVISDPDCTLSYAEKWAIRNLILNDVFYNTEMMLLGPILPFDVIGLLKNFGWEIVHS